MAIMNSMLPIFLILILKIQYNILIQESFLFVLVGIPMDEILWKEIVLSTSTQFLNHYFYVFRKQVNVSMMLEIHVKPHFQTINISRNEMDPTTPGCRGLYLGYHFSCQVVLEDNSYTHLVSLTTYILWNYS